VAMSSPSFRKLQSVCAMRLSSNGRGGGPAVLEVLAVLRAAVERGVTFFDTADTYNFGRSEEIMGATLMKMAKREDFVLSTKVGIRMSDNQNDVGTGRKHLMASVDAQLKRLQTDYIDLYQVHRLDPHTPIEETMYSLDQIGGHPEGTEVLTYFGTNQFTGGADGVMGFTYYPIIEEFAVTGMQIELANGTVVGGTLQVSLHDSTTLMADDPTPIEVSNDHEVTQADLDAGVINVAFDNPVTLDPGSYYAGITMYSNENANDIRVLDDLTVPQPGISSALFLDATLYSNINALALRLSSDPTIGMEESRLTGVGVYPNPSTGLVNVAFVNTGKYTVDVLNSLGQTVQRTRMNGTSTMDLSTMPKGVYSLRISNGTATTVDRVVLQ